MISAENEEKISAEMIRMGEILPKLAEPAELCQGDSERGKLAISLNFFAEKERNFRSCLFQTLKHPFLKMFML